MLVSPLKLYLHTDAVTRRAGKMILYEYLHRAHHEAHAWRTHVVWWLRDLNSGPRHAFDGLGLPADTLAFHIGTGEK